MAIYGALQEQLGLRLESQKGPVEMIVVERAQSRQRPEPHPAGAPVTLHSVLPF